MNISASLLDDTRNFSTRNLWEAKKLYESRSPEKYSDEGEATRHEAIIAVLKERGELPDAVCEPCSQEQSLYCPACRAFTCKHYSLEPEPGEHRCNWCERELEEFKIN